jgi:hypothetical protein
MLLSEAANEDELFNGLDALAVVVVPAGDADDVMSDPTDPSLSSAMDMVDESDSIASGIGCGIDVGMDANGCCC